MLLEFCSETRFNDKITLSVPLIRCNTAQRTYPKYLLATKYLVKIKYYYVLLVIAILFNLPLKLKVGST